MKTIKQYASIVNEAVSRLAMPSEPAGLYEPIKYALAAGGKRLRPVLALAACEAYGKPWEQAINQALAVEMFHNFTLLHDDVMDKASVRRGRPTVHIRYDENTAILSGDTMLTLAGRLAMHACPDERLRAVVGLLDKTAIEVYEGQQYDMDFEKCTDVSVDEYINMIRLKTSVLLGCACKMGALMAGASDECAEAMYRYGEKLGLAFQLQDDYLDTFGDPATFGKEIGGDILNEKKTWLLINAMAEAPMEMAMAMAKEGVEKVEAVRDVYLALGLPDRCHSLIDDYADEAVAALDDARIPEDACAFFADLAMNSRSRKC